MALRVGEHNLCHSVWDEYTVLARDNDAARGLQKESLLISAADNPVSHRFLSFNRATRSLVCSEEATPHSVMSESPF